MRQLSNPFLAELFSQESSDPFLMLVTLTHDTFDTVYLVNNTENITSRSVEYVAFPMIITLPADDGESQRRVRISLDNASRELIEEIRSVVSPIQVKIEAVLASQPDTVEIELDELKLGDVSYTSTSISGNLYFDDFLNTELPSERYTPSNFRGLFA